MSKYLEPAHTVIRKFSPDGSLRAGIEVVSKVTGSDKTAVYRWMRPKKKGGTGGLVPTKQQPKLLEYAQHQQIPIQAAELIREVHAA